MLTIILCNIIEVMLLELEWNQQRVTAEIMKYKELLDEGIITEEKYLKAVCGKTASTV